MMWSNNQCEEGVELEFSIRKRFTTPKNSKNKTLYVDRGRNPQERAQQTAHWRYMIARNKPLMSVRQQSEEREQSLARDFDLLWKKQTHMKIGLLDRQHMMNGPLNGI